MLKGFSPNRSLVRLEWQLGRFQFVVECSLNRDLNPRYYFKRSLLSLKKKNALDFKSDTE